MTDSRLKVKNLEIKHLFTSMDYAKQEYNTDLAKVWLNQHNSVSCSDGKHDKINELPSAIIQDLYNENISIKICTPEENEIANLLQSNVDRTWYSVAAIDKIRIINKFAVEIETNSELICQVDLLIRGISPKDTKKHCIKLITEYLQYYANCSLGMNNLQKKQGPLAAIISDDNSLVTIGYMLALGLTLGTTIVLQTGPRISVCASLIKELAINAGIPANAIKLIPGLVLPNEILSVSIGTVYVFDNIHSEKFSSVQIHSDNRVVAVTNLKTSAIVFDNADLDSACNSIINAVWEYQGLLPWSVDTIIVQEDIFENFVEKLKDRLSKLHIGSGLETPDDISHPNSAEAVQKLREMVNTAHNQGIRVFQFPEDGDGFKPTLFVGGKAFHNNVIIENNNDIPCANVLAFRTANEAVSLANNGRQGLGVSVWSQNVDLLNEVVLKLEVGTVWANCHGICKANVAFTIQKGSGIGYFGGLEGLHECIDSFPTLMSVEKQESSSAINDLVASARKAQKIWSNLSILSRMQKLSYWALEIANMKTNLEFELNAETWIATIYKSFEQLIQHGSSTYYDKKFYLNTYFEPLGVIALGASEEEDFIKTLIGALVLGNVVIVIVNDDSSKKYSLLKKALLSQILYICENSDFYGVINHKDVNAIISKSSPRNKSVTQCKKIYRYQDDWNFVLRRVTQIKNVWLTVGDSFA